MTVVFAAFAALQYGWLNSRNRPGSVGRKSRKQALTSDMSGWKLAEQGRRHLLVGGVSVDAADLAALRVIMANELDHLEPYNCTRYELARGMTQRWIDAARPR